MGAGPASAYSVAVSLESSRVHTWFTWSAAVNAAVALLLLALGVTLAFGQKAVIHIHAGVAMLFVLTSVLAAVFAVLYALRSGQRGLIGHSVGLVVLALIQFGLGEMGGFTIVHIILGLLIVPGAVMLYFMARKPEVTAAPKQ